jgi:EAL domain-containing protein (putative c-di-GMP-specific phosphodiesterase class I)
VALQGGNEAQFEALLRMPLNDGNILSYEELRAKQSEHGANAEIDRWLLNRCLATLDERARRGTPLKRLFVQQSADSMLDSNRLAWLTQSLETRRLQGSSLHLELRLNDVVRELKHAIHFFNAMNSIGVRLVLDQFESSLTSLQLLSYLPVHGVKISDKYTTHFAQLRDELIQLIQTAHAGGKQVIVGRVEDARIASQLWTMGVDFIQGNFVQPPSANISFDFQASVN